MLAIVKKYWKISISLIITLCLFIVFLKIIFFKDKNILAMWNQGTYRQEVADNEMYGKFEGQWNLTDTHSSITSTILITEQDDKGFHFVIDAGYFMHSDTIEGEARFESPESAVYVVKDDTQSSITFILSDNILNVEKSGCPISPGVDIVGKYTLDEPTYVNSDILNTVYTETELTAIESLLPEDKYENYFIFCSKNGLCEEEEITLPNDISARNIYVYVPTAGMAYSVIITDQEAIYIKLFDAEKSFYTNDNSWKSNEMPVIEESAN